MENITPELSPEEIRTIRKNLGLTQVEAGELLGGGPRAFTKYEAGTIKPVAAVVNLLRLLEANPGALSALNGGKPTPILTAGTKPYEVTGRNISALTERELPVLLRRLLNAEAQVNGLIADGVHVASNVTIADGGEDGRIIWTGGPERTDYLPARCCQFQLKAGKVGPSLAAKDVLTKSGVVKDMVRVALEQGGNYLMLCAHSYVQKQIDARQKLIIDAIRSTGLSIEDEQVAFRDADQIADWVNLYPSVASWVLERTQPGLVGPFRSWAHWSGCHEHDFSPWMEDERLPALRAQLREAVVTPQSVSRVVGLSGVGKSRLILEALGPIEEDTSLSDIVLYAVESEAGSGPIKKAVQNLANSAGRAIVVVDGCSAEMQRELSGMVLRASSRLSLITIEDEILEDPLGEGIFKINRAPTSVIEGIVDNISPGIPNEDRWRLVHFSKGFPKIAFRVCESWNTNKPIAHSTEDDLVDRFVLGRRTHEPAITLKTAKLLAIFGVVRLSGHDNRLMGEISSLGRGLSEDAFYAAAEELVRRGIAKSYGRDIVLQPIPIALRLAERQWHEWCPSQWDRVLAGETSPELKVVAARRLALLNTTNIAMKVTKHVCRLNGSLNGRKGISQPGHSELLSFLAEISPEVVVRLIENSLSEVELSAVDGDVRCELVQALEKLAFDSTTFEDSARLLLRLAADEHDTGGDRRLLWDNSAVDRFSDLFPMFLGNTSASSQERLTILDEAADSDDPTQRLIAVTALIKGAETRDFWRFRGPETHGSRPALKPWRPKTWDDARAYVNHCVEKLAELAQQDDAPGVKASAELGRELRSLVGFGLIDTVEKVTKQVCATQGGYWPEAQESLGHFIRFDTKEQNDDVVVRVKKLIKELEPESLSARVRFLVTGMPWDYPSGENLEFQEREEFQLKIVNDLAADLVAQPQTLTAILPRLCKGDHRWAGAFGQAVAESAAMPCDWLNPIKTAIAEAPETDRNYDLLAGYLAGLSNAVPNIVDAFKEEAAKSPQYAPGLPLICWRLGIKRSDVRLVISALNAEILPPRHLVQWAVGGVLAKVPEFAVAPLFDVMLDRDPETYAIGMQLLNMYCFPDIDRLDGLRRHVLKVAENVDKWPQSLMRQKQPHFERIMEWMLKKGRDDADARETALILARKMTSLVESGNQEFIAPLVPTLLSRFPEVVWPLIGQAVIVADPQYAWRYEHVLGDKRVGDKRESVILDLPEETLFAWCHAHPEAAPARLAVLVPILASNDPNEELKLHPVARRLLKEFGDRDDVIRGFSENMITFSWTGSVTTYFARYKAPFEGLLNHPIAKVRHWARRTLHWLDEEIQKAHGDDEEFEAQLEM